MLRVAQMTLDILSTGDRGRWYLRSKEPIDHAASRICEEFGGGTCSMTSGCWFDASRGTLVYDTSVTWTVALEPSQWPRFRALAAELALGQDTVYLVSPLGEALIDKVPMFVEVVCDG